MIAVIHAAVSAWLRPEPGATGPPGPPPRWGCTLPRPLRLAEIRVRGVPTAGCGPVGEVTRPGRILQGDTPMAGAGITSGKRRNRVAWAGALVALAALAAGCSSASSSTGSTAAAGSTGSASTSCPNGCKLTVVTPNLDPSSAITIYLADDLGYFTKYGVNVSRINGVAAGSVPLLTSGKADLIDEGATAAFPVAAQGKQISAIYNDIGGGALGGLAVAANSKYTSVNSLSGQRVGTVGTDGTQYGFASLFSGDVKKAAGTGFTIVSFTDNTTLSYVLEAGDTAGVSGT